MRQYQFQVRVETARGRRVWFVDAHNHEEAWLKTYEWCRVQGMNPHHIFIH